MAERPDSSGAPAAGRSGTAGRSGIAGRLRAAGRSRVARRSRAAGWVGPLLGTIAVVAFLAALVVGYTQRALFNSDQFAARAASTLKNDAVRSEIAVTVTDQVVLNADEDLVAFRPLIEDVTRQLVGGSAFQSLFRSSVADVHRAVFSEDQHSVTLTLINLGIVLRAALERVAPDIADQVVPDVRIVDMDPPDAILRAVQIAEDARFLFFLLLGIALVTGAAAVFLSGDRRESIRRGAIGVAGGATLLLVTYWVLRTRSLAMIHDPGMRDAVAGIWAAYLEDLRDLLLATAALAAVVAAAAAALIRPLGLERPLLTTLEVFARRPERTWLRALRAAAFLIAGIIIVTDTAAFLQFVALVFGVALIYVGVQELLRLVIKPAEEGAAPPERRPLVSRNVLLTGVFCAAAIVIAGTALLATTVVVSNARVELPGCNGHKELCDRSLPEVTLPATHNSFSAADQRSWLFAQHESGIAAQLEGGIRGFLIDTHWGRKTADGSVITDLSDEGNKSRQQYVDEFGAEVVDAALKVRDSLGDSANPSSPPSIYLCHGFCEVGARLLADDLEAMRDFLLANPHQVIVVIVQNEGVGPEDFAAAVSDAGLDQLVYRGSVEDWPTLGEMIERNQRIVFMAENPPFDVVPWIHEAYAITQETPYHFNRPAQLTDPKQLPASCVENRGPADAPMFLVNHWIDTSPAPRPSNARLVNAYDPLLERARECERIRGLRANLLAVDFWRTGDVLGVADTLNGFSPEP